MDTLASPEDSMSQSSIGKKKSTQVISMLRKPFARKNESPVRLVDLTFILEFRSSYLFLK